MLSVRAVFASRMLPFQSLQQISAKQASACTETDSTSNLPEAPKAAKLKKLQGHLELAQQERRIDKHSRQLVQATTECSQQACHALTISLAVTALTHTAGESASRPYAAWTSVLFCTRKDGILRIGCEGLPRQVNFSVDELHLKYIFDVSHGHSCGTSAKTEQDYSRAEVKKNSYCNFILLYVFTDK